MFKKSIFILLILALSACAPATQLEADAPIKVKAIVLPYTSYGPFFIAQEEGFFAEQGLEVEFVRLESGSVPMPMLENGEVDVFGTGPTLSFFNLIANGSAIRAVADKGYMSPTTGCAYMGIMASKNWLDENQQVTAESFAGKSISIDTTNFEGFLFDSYLKQYDLSLADMSAQDIAPPALAEAANNGSVDLISIGDPWITRIQANSSATLWMNYADMVPDMQFGLVLFGPSITQKNPEAGAKFLAGYLKGINQYAEGKTDRNIEIMMKYTNLDAEILKAACWPPMNSKGVINTATLTDFQNWAFDSGLTDAKVDVSQYWDGSYLEAAQKMQK